MPIISELRDDDHILYSVITEPLTLRDLVASMREQMFYYDKTPGKLHQLANVSMIQHVPVGILSVREYSPAFTHPKRGHLIIVGANSFLRSVAEVMVKLARSESFKFFKEEPEAWDYLRQVIAAESASAARA